MTTLYCLLLIVVAANLRHLVSLNTSNRQLEFLGTALNFTQTGVNFVSWHCCSPFFCSLGRFLLSVGNYWNFIVIRLILLANYTTSFIYCYYIVISTRSHVVQC